MHARPQGLFLGSPRDRAGAVLLGILILAAFLPTLVELGREWVDVPEYGHGLLMPPVAAWMIWSRRRELGALRRGADNRWLPLLGALALVPLTGVLLLGEMNLSWFLKPLAFVGALTACIALLYSWRGVRALAAPLLVLLLMCPVPWRLVIDVTLPLKRHASVLATGLMDLSGLEAGLQGNLIHVPGITSLWIADQCSGVRSLLSLASVAIVGCLFWRRHWGVKLAVILSCIPITVAVNALRIWLTAVLAVHVSPEAAQGFFHVGEGFLLFLAAAAILWVWARALSAVLPGGRLPRSKPTRPAPALPARPFAPRVAYAAAVAVLALAAVGVYHVRARVADVPDDADAVARMRDAFSGLPLDVAQGAYRGEPLEWDEEIIRRSGADAYGAVRYEDGDGRVYQVYLAGAVRTASNFHAPNVCMPSADWETLAAQSVAYTGDPVAGTSARMQRLLLQRGEDRMITYYWFQAGTRPAGGEWTVRFYRLLDLLRNEPLSPTMIVSIYVPVRGSIEATEAAARGFLSTIGPHLREATASGGTHG
ncbi:MAG: exosortase C-terminal domain/associated protein EpsI [Planctomycetota bacterium]